jgi:hypothetical protein
MRTSINTRVSQDFYNQRKKHHEQLLNALKGLNMPEINIDRLYAKKLSNISIQELLNLKNEQIKK